MLINDPLYLYVIENLKQKVKSAQYKAVLSADTEMILLYHRIGFVINEHSTWGRKFIDNMSGVSRCHRLLGA